MWFLHFSSLEKGHRPSSSSQLCVSLPLNELLGCPLLVLTQARHTRAVKPFLHCRNTGVRFLAWGVCWISGPSQHVLSGHTISVLISSVHILNPEVLLNLGIKGLLFLNSYLL